MCICSRFYFCFYIHNNHLIRLKKKKKKQKKNQRYPLIGLLKRRRKGKTDSDEKTTNYSCVCFYFFPSCILIKFELSKGSTFKSLRWSFSSKNKYNYKKKVFEKILKHQTVLPPYSYWIMNWWDLPDYGMFGLQVQQHPAQINIAPIVAMGVLQA